MTSSRFFRTVWRVNGLLVLLTFVLAAGGALAGILTSISWGARNSGAEPVAARTEQGEPLSLGDVEEVGGTPFVILPFSTRNEASKFSSGAEPSVTRNLLFFEASTGATRWLRPDRRAAVAERAFIHAPGRPGHDEVGPVRFVRYEIAEADTDGDGQVTDEDARSVAVSGPGGEELTTVLSELDAILGYRELEDGTALLVFFRRGTEHFAARVDLPARKVTRTTRLPAD